MSRMAPALPGYATITRRAALLGCLATPFAARAGADFDVHYFEEARKGVPASRFAILIPRHQKETVLLGTVVALHGLGETHDQNLGIRAWFELYGLAQAYRRLLHPPIAKTSLRTDFEVGRIQELNEALARDPFRGLCVVCPYTPNPKKLTKRTIQIGAYAEWIEEVALVQARKLARLRSDRASIALVGCSMGATVALDVLLARPNSYGGVGFVQGALSRHSAAANAKTIGHASANGKFDVHLLSSKQDPFLDGHRALAQELSQRKVAHQLGVAPGPHDQPWLRESGSLEMLFYQDRARNPRS